MEGVLVYSAPLFVQLRSFSGGAYKLQWVGRLPDIQGFTRLLQVKVAVLIDEQKQRFALPCGTEGNIMSATPAGMVPYDVAAKCGNGV